VGKTIRVASRNYSSSGSPRRLAPFLGSHKTVRLLPFQAYEQIWHTGQTSILILVQAKSPEMIGAAEDEVRMILRRAAARTILRAR